MSFVLEMNSCFSSLDVVATAFWLGCVAAAPVLGMVLAGTKEGEEEEKRSEANHPEAAMDAEEMRTLVKTLEGKNTRTLEENEELANLYASLAMVAFEEDEDLTDIVCLFGQAEEVLKNILKYGEDLEIRRHLGKVYQFLAEVYSDYEEFDAAIESYLKVIGILQPLEDDKDGEAMYDIAGIKQKRGEIYHEIGDFDKATTDLNEAFTAFRAVEKISDLDTRKNMGRVSILQGNLLRDMDEPLDKIVDAYNRAMRLFIELIEAGQMQYERDLAEALMERCVTTFEEYTGIESEEERTSKCGAVLVDVGHAIGILEKITWSEGMQHQIDLFDALSAKVSMLMELEEFSEAMAICDRILADFSDLVEDTDPVLLNQFAVVYESRGFCRMNIDETEAAIADFDESIRLSELLQSDDFDLDEQDRLMFQMPLATYYADRASAYADLGDKEKAKEDCQHGLDLIQSIKEKIGDTPEDQEEFQEIEQMFKTLMDQWT